VTLTISDLVRESHATALAKGWYEGRERGLPELIALCHSELSEALEEWRNGHAPAEVYHLAGGKPEGVPIEMADLLIRVADLCGFFGIDLEAALREKMAFNLTRPQRHGGKLA
jgi:NTP pyrophosphatase (non-canonical NTP hydrolase)